MPSAVPSRSRTPAHISMMDHVTPYLGETSLGFLRNSARVWIPAGHPQPSSCAVLTRMVIFLHRPTSRQSQQSTESQSSPAYRPALIPNIPLSRGSSLLRIRSRSGSICSMLKKLGISEKQPWFFSDLVTWSSLNLLLPPAPEGLQEATAVDHGGNSDGLGDLSPPPGTPARPLEEAALLDYFLLPVPKDGHEEEDSGAASNHRSSVSG